MKKLIALPLILGMSTAAHSDLLFGVYGGAGIWNASVEGDIGVGDDPITADELGLDSENNNVFYLAIEHPVPLIPNIKVQHTAITSEGTATTRGFSLDSITFDAETEATTELDLTHTDLTLYFEILDNYLSLDVGLTARQFDGLARVQGVSGGESSTEEVDLDLTIPLLYGKAQIDLPFTGWFVGGTINYLSISDNTVSDIEAKIGYLNGGLGLDFGFEAGLRRMTVETDDEGDLTADATISGPYAEVIFHF